ncbi:hypothetical protein BAUCODRAFT_36493 [Baudoinia panamericana UAMH 10762]|uniref:FAD dependent oxidoreductase domain-containing protein n=1 Tax=Baudoinia panamericana (strain UAMH 10762) TaxID=717646 RepID=M2LIN0_BAUPA|nr:uncharacterized protein BAUCODRAFT_36493 [Baudoinia panamericana UAMH 10762]EMC94022.1 hypothetical protein BAUCODRAFT_36493 [Baudoinia panamericana UAMH 10762]
MSREHPSLPTSNPPASLPTPHSSHSFWHSEPSPLLLGHRSTRTLPRTADIVIIGSGITGTSAAHHILASTAPATNTHTLNVVMLEAREACWGATGRNGGHCQPLLFESPHDPSIGRFELANFHALQHLIADKQIDCEFVPQPGVRAIMSQHHLDEAATALEIMKTTAPDLRSMLRLVTDKAELASYRIPTAKGAVVTTLAARMWPYKFVSRLLCDLLTSPTLPSGGTFNLQTLTPATALTPTPTAEGGGWTVQTPRGSIHAQRVILATNAYTSHLLPSFADLIVPCRGQMSALHPLPSLQGEKRLKTSLGFLGDGLDDYLIQRPNERGGHLMFGGGRQEGTKSVGVTDDSVVDAPTEHYLRTKLVSAFDLPEGKDDPATMFEAVNVWSGIMGSSRDERPWVGPVPDQDGVFLAAGYTGHGMPNTWLCGKAVAEMAVASLSGGGGGGGVVGEEGEEEEVVMAGLLPESYRLTRERMERAAKSESVEEKDWAEMRRGGGRSSGRSGSGSGLERVPSGYA